MQNRLFLIHSSNVAGRTELLRCAFGTKELAIKDFVSNFNNVKIFDYNGAKAALLIIFENEDKHTGWIYHAEDSLCKKYVANV